LGGSNTNEKTILFVLPVAVGVLGILDFLVIGFILLTYHSKQAQVNVFRQNISVLHCLFIQMC